MEMQEKQLNSGKIVQDKRALFESVPVVKALLTMAIPTIVSQLITMIYNIADTFFIGMTNDPYKVAAASVVSILFFILSSLANLFGVGGGSLMSRLLGEKKEKVKWKECCGISFLRGVFLFLAKKEEETEK